ncbi:hypothetical protein C0584_00145 [Candidatus Parcubacteria bacterium]|nr:MAG: hypothetical protein C0584_00145 [Candidatus Parcubacteria bacterium]
MLMKIIITVFSVIITAYFIPGVLISGPWAALWTALILGIVNVFLRPLFILFTLPLNILTLGLFTFVINAVMIMLVASIVEGFSVSGFLPALFFSIALSLLTAILNKFIADKAI